MALGDFDGDGVSDVFRADGAEWRWSRGGTDPWATLKLSSVLLPSLLFADLDGDGRSDVMASWSSGGSRGGQWMVSWGGSAAWSRLQYSGTPLSEVGVGDFDGDGVADIFTSGCL